MSRFVATVILALLPVLAAAQQFSMPIQLSNLEARPMLARQAVRLGDLSLGGRSLLPQARVTATLPGWAELRYTFRARKALTDAVTPEAPWTLGGQTFGKKDATQKPVNVDWGAQAHLIELSGATQWPLQPLIVVRGEVFDLKATGYDADDKAIEATNRIQKWTPAVGAAFRLGLGSGVADVRAAGWRDYWRISAGCRYSPLPYVTCGVEYLVEEIRAKGLIDRTDGVMGSVGLAF